MTGSKVSSRLAVIELPGRMCSAGGARFEASAPLLEDFLSATPAAVTPPAGSVVPESRSDPSRSTESSL